MSLVRHVLSHKGSEVAVIDRNATVFDAAKRMMERRIGSLVVMESDSIEGIMTERDLLNRVIAVGKYPAKTKVAEVMTERVAFCTRDTTLEACRTVMTNHKLRHLPVVEDNKLMGIISSGDILARELKDQEETIRYLHEYMQGPN